MTHPRGDKIGPSLVVSPSLGRTPDTDGESIVSSSIGLHPPRIARNRVSINRGKSQNRSPVRDREEKRERERMWRDP